MIFYLIIVPFYHAEMTKIWKQYFLWLVQVSTEAAFLNPYLLSYTLAQTGWVFVMF